MTQTIIKIPAAGAFDPTDIEITDNTSGAWLIKDDAGTPHEYMRIDTTTGSKETTFTVDYDAAGSNLWKVGTNRTASSGDMLVVNSRNTGLGFIEGVFLAGPASSQVWVSGPGVFRLQGCNFIHNMTGSNSATTYLGTAADWIVTRGSPSEEMIKFEHDSNMTFTLDTTSNGVFKIQDNLASPTQFLTIDSNTASESIKLALTPQNADRYLEITNSKIHARQQNSQINMGTQGITFTAYDDYAFGQFGTGKKLLFKDSSSAEERFSVDKESNATFTLDDGSAATFTITDNASPTPRLHLRCTESASSTPLVEVNGLLAFPTKQLTLTSTTYGTAFNGSINQGRLSVSLGATSTTRNISIGAVNMDAFAQILTATPSTTGQTFTLDFNNTNTALSGLPIGLYKIVLKNAGTQSCTFTAASTMASGGRVKGVDISGASIGVIDSSSGSITAAAGETIYVEVTNHVSDSAGGDSNRFIICKTICKI